MQRENLLAVANYLEVCPTWLLTGEGNMLNTAPKEEPTESTEVEDIVLTIDNSIRYYPDLPATASDIENMPMDNHPYFELMYIKGLEGHLAVPAVGRSMEPTIHAGDIVVHKPYTDRFIQNGDIYIICTTSGQRMIKMVILHLSSPNGIRPIQKKVLS